MNLLVRRMFSMQMATLCLVVFMFAIAVATFLESIYDLQTAKLMVYNALWFEFLLFYLTVCLIVNTFIHHMWQAQKIAILIFHLSFILILSGAGITRHFGYEGIMRLPEPDSHTGILRPVDYIYSADPKLRITVENKYVEETMFLSEVVNKRFSVDFHLPEKNKKINVKLSNFQSKHVDSLVVHDSITDHVLNIVTAGNKSNYLSLGNSLLVGNIPLFYESTTRVNVGINIRRINGRYFLTSSVPMRYLPMSEMQRIRQTGEDVPDSLYKIVPIDSLVPFNSGVLYYIGDQSFVFKEVVQQSRIIRVPSGRKDVGEDFVTLTITDGDEQKVISVAGGLGVIASEERFSFNGLSYSVQYGSIPIRLPFSVACREFTLHRYPGSNSPSSYESIVTITDLKQNVEKTRKIFMNNVIDYEGFRFFQSSYFPDETGTVLSVNYDWWGTMISYLGYLLMSVGMLLSLFAPAGRFKELNQKLKKIAQQRSKNMGLMSVFVVISLGIFAQDSIPEGFHLHQDGSLHANDHAIEESSIDPRTTSENTTPKIALYASLAHVEKLNYLMVQDYSGRIVPFHTLCDQLLRKIHRNNKFKDGDHTYNAVQTILSMHMNPEAWLTKKIIYVSKVLRDTLNLNGVYASFMDLINDTQDEFKLSDEYQQTHQKLDKEKGEFDKQLVKLVERFQVFSEIQMWQYMRLMPISGDMSNTWYTPFSTQAKTQEPELYNIAMNYFQALSKATHNNEFDVADGKLNEFITLQRQIGNNIAPSVSKIRSEVRYNKMNIFKNSQYSYFIFGFVLLIIFLVRLLSNAGRQQGKAIKIIKRIFTFFVFIIFVYHGYGLAMRWYISGHAPWSNGYEAVVFVAWMTVLAGFVFSKKNAVILASTCILAFFMLFVTEMNILDPEITPLVPVLKSYWLMIHVAIITGSYAFLGLGSILGLINLFLYIFRTSKNGKILTWNIKELTYVSEMSLTIGIFMLTIGTFLGGVWANESWGRYWGWDPKETWALVSILVYAIVLHLRFIPSLKSTFLFNVVSFWSYGMILFTFFGVNFYLVGLHSYAQGDGLGEFPRGVIVTIVLFYILTELAYLQYKKYSYIARRINEITASLLVRKMIVTISVFIFIYILFVIMQVIDINTALEISWKTATIVVLTNLFLILYYKLLTYYKPETNL